MIFRKPPPPPKRSHPIRQLAFLLAAGATLGVAVNAHQHPASAQSRDHAGARWPFPEKNWNGQFRSVDEGIDLQYPGTTPVAVRAVAAGRVVQLGPDPAKDGGFGVAYPGLVLDHPVTVHRNRYTEIYYGHTFLRTGIVGQHVHRGEVIGHTGGAHSGGNASGLSNWLEVGFFPPSYANGPAMRHWLSKGGS